MNRLPLLLLALCTFLPVARADRREDDRREEESHDHRDRGPRVIVFQHANYQGDALVLYPGDALDNLSKLSFANGGRLNDSISSIRVDEGAEVYVYADSRFRGPVLRLAESARDLTSYLLPDSVNASWNDRISSLRVEERRRGPGGKRANPEEMVREAYLTVLNREPDPSGLDHYRRLITDQGWTGEMVRDNIRHGDEFRHEGANRIIRQAYQDVLGRDPRPDELEHYRKILLARDWLGNDVREDLKRGDEYRKNPHRR